MKLFAYLLLILGLTGCVTSKEWVATGGSRSDGIVRLSYEYGMFEQPQVNEEQAVKLATGRCAAWGYTGAEAFGGITRNCSSPTYSGCNAWIVTKEYQCVGRLEK